MVLEVNQRLHGLDFCRAVFMLLGLLHHVGLVYGSGQEWRVNSDQTSLFLQGVSDFIHYFRMEAFYLLSGFFFILVFSKGKDGFLKDRISRALIPLIFCGLCINPVMNYYSYNFEIAHGLDYFFAGDWLGHLWFLGNLIVYFVVTSLFCRLIVSSREIAPQYLPLLFYFLVPFLGVVSMAISKFTFDGVVLFISFNTLLYYYVYFLLGCFLYRNKEGFVKVLRLRNFFISFSIFFFFFLVAQMEAFSNDLINKALTRMSSGGLVLSMMSIVYFIGAKNLKFTRNVSDSSYTVYLLHQPLVVVLSVFVFERITLGALSEYVLMVFIVFFTSYFFHFWVVNTSYSMKLLFNGVLSSGRK